MKNLALLLSIGATLVTARTNAQTFTYNNDFPNDLVGMASRPESPGKIEIESADDFFSNSSPTRIVEEPITGQDVRFNVNFTTPFTLPADHYFFIPQVELTGADDNFFWLSAERPILSGTPIVPDLQTWIRNANLDPDWLRVGTDIIGGNPAPTFNGSFSLTGTVPDTGSSAVLFAGGVVALFYLKRRSRTE